MGDDARDAIARLSALISSQQIVLTQRQAADTERFQQLLTLVGTAVLVPGLVAAIFGANVNTPGKGGESAFWAMLFLMVASGAGSYALLRSLQGQAWLRIGERLKLDRLSQTARLLILAGAALVALVVGLIVLL